MEREYKLKLIDNCILAIAIISAILSLYYLIFNDSRLIFTSIVSACAFLMFWINNK